MNKRIENYIIFCHVYYFYLDLKKIRKIYQQILSHTTLSLEIIYRHMCIECVNILKYPNIENQRRFSRIKNSRESRNTKVNMQIVSDF